MQHLFDSKYLSIFPMLKRSYFLKKISCKESTLVMAFQANIIKNITKLAHYNKKIQQGETDFKCICESCLYFVVICNFSY